VNDLTANCMHVFIDIVGYSKNRTVESQVTVINALNDLVVNVVGTLQVPRRKVVFLPTGDGMCITLLNATAVAIRKVVR
jgi:hypothetical protein